MSSLTREAYIAVLRDFEQCFRVTCVSLVLADYEVALRQACAIVFPESRIAGCATHYDRVFILLLIYFLKIQHFLTFYKIML